MENFRKCCTHCIMHCTVTSMMYLTFSLYHITFRKVSKIDSVEPAQPPRIIGKKAWLVSNCVKSPERLVNMDARSDMTPTIKSFF